MKAPLQRIATNFAAAKTRSRLKLWRYLMLALTCVASLIITLCLAAPRQSSNGREVASVKDQTQKPNSQKGPQAVSIAATLADDITLAQKKDPGGTITYTAVITNSGTDATGVTFTDILDSNTALVPGSVKTTPIAFNDSYSVIGNVRIQPNAAAGLLVNDIDPDTGNNTGLTATAQTISSTNCAACNNVIINADGSFSYNPPVGFTGTDTFTYTVNDATAKTGTGTVTLNVSGMVWFINNGAAGCTTLTLASGCGRLTNPFSTLAAFQSFNDGGAGPPTHPKANDNIFIYESGTSYTGPVTLLSGQKLIGQDSTSTLSTITGLTPQSYSDAFPTMNTGGNASTITSAGNDVTLGSGNTLNGFTAGAATTTAISGSSFGTLTVADVIVNTTGAGLSLTNGVLSATFSSVTSSGGTNNILLDTGGTSLTGSLTINGGSLSSATGDSFKMSGAGTSTATVSDSGTIASGSAHSINIANKTGGTVTFSGAVTDTDTGITLTSNTNATINFSGGISATTTTNTAFNATGGGTVNVTGTNTLNTTTGTALNVANTTIGASGLTFRSITSTGSSANAGIVLDNTGTSGSLTVTGNGGTCTVATPTCTGGQIANKTGADILNGTNAAGNTTSGTNGTGIFLRSTSNPSFALMKLNDFTNFGIYGKTVTGFSLSDSIIIGTNGSNSSGDREEGAVRFDNLLGNPSITNCVLGGTGASDQSASDDLRVMNVSGTLNRLTVSNTSFGKIVGSPVGGNNGSLVDASGGATVNVTITDSIYTNSVGTDADFTFAQATMDVVFRRNKLSNNNVNASSGSGLFVLQGGSSAHTVTYDISCNKLQDAIGIALLVASGTGSGTIVGDIINNAIGVSGVNKSGSTQASGIKVKATGSGTHTTLIRDNVVLQTEEEGIFVQNNDGSATLNASVFHNTVAEPGTLPTAQFAGLNVDVGALAGDTSVVNVVVGSAGTASDKNDFSAGDPSNFSDVNFSTIGGASINLSKNGSGSGTAAAVIDDDNLNPANTNTAVSATGGPLTLVTTLPTLPPGVAACTQPTIARPDEGDVATNAQPILNPGNDSSLQSYASNTDGGSRSIDSSVTSSWLSQVLRPVAFFASRLNFLRSSEEPTERGTSPRVSKGSESTIEPNGALPDGRASAPSDQKPVSPQSGETITVNGSGAGFTLPAGKSITITYQATVNTPPGTKQVSTQGTVSGSNFSSVLTDDPEQGGASDATKTNINTTLTWTGTSSTDWDTAGNWDFNYIPQSYSDVVIPTGALTNEPSISSSNPTVFSFSIANTHTLTLTGHTLTISGAAAGSDLTLNGIIDGGTVSFAGAGPHGINNAGGTGSLSATNLMTVLSPAAVTLNDNLQAGAVQVNSGGSLTITGKTLSLNGSGTALSVAGTLTPVRHGDGESAPPAVSPNAIIEVANSTVVFDGTSAQTASGLTYNSLTINNSAGVTFTGDSTVNGTLTLTAGDLHMGASDEFTLTQPNTTATLPANGGGDVTGSVKRTGSPVPATTALTFGNANNQITLATSTLTSLTVKLIKSVPTDANTGQTTSGFPGAVQRTYLITPAGGAFTNATLRLHYLDSELNGNTEGSGLRLWKFITSPVTGWQQQDPPGSVTTFDSTNNWVQKTGVAGFSPWTIANSSPTAANANVSGRIVDANGNPVEGAGVRMSGTQNRLTVTDANGNYHFDNVDTNGFYTVMPSRANYRFTPQLRSFSQLGLHTEAAFTATLNGDKLNPLDTSEYFVRQQYVDFLNREPDEAGLTFWVNNIEACGTDQVCRDAKRTDTSAAFFLSIEFQQTGFEVYRTYLGAFGDVANTPVPLRLSEFQSDSRALGSGVIVGQDGWEQTLEDNQQAYMSGFVQRAKFTTAYPTALSPIAFVDQLFANAGVTPSDADRTAAINEFGSAANTNDLAARARALRSVTESATLIRQQFNSAFVLMQYFGYLRRDPNAFPDTNFDGYNFWLGKLDSFNGSYQNAEMVKAFLSSNEYRNRFPR